MQSNRRRRGGLTAVLAVALASIAVVAVWWLFWPAEPDLTLARLQSVKVGMTRAQVWEFVGAPPGTYPRGAACFQTVGLLVGNEVWTCARSGNELHVWYDAEGRVADAV